MIDRDNKYDNQTMGKNPKHKTVHNDMARLGPNDLLLLWMKSEIIMLMVMVFADSAYQLTAGL